MQDKKITKLVDELRAKIEELNEITAKLQAEKVYFQIKETAENSAPFRRKFSLDRVFQTVDY